uniref:HAT C-terminal dimerisation domain-containing protein n=1 Tax=Amphimedon queenslandica TaxID=400682 RepID=A0A1X7VUB1_AMPQE
MESVMDVYKQINPLQLAFPTLRKLLRIALTIAVSTAQFERSFSALKRIKNYLKTSMAEQRLTDMSILSIEKDLSKNISFEDVLERFESGDKNTSIILS